MKLTLYGITAVWLRHPDDFNLVARNPQRFVKDGTGMENISG
jgi:hypothetical protein